MQSVSVSVAAVAILFVGLACAHPIYQSFELADKPCPDKKTNCSSTATCCHIADNEYGCCKYTDAVCCTDKKHCCPKDTKCDPTKGECTKAGSNQLFAMEEIEISAPQVVTCSDKSTCPNGYTCCKLPDKDGYGCCPLKAAVCCKGGLRCCPTDYQCNSDGTCTDIFLDILMQRKVHDNSPASVVCPDGQSECPDGNTCCKLSSGQWGCCPLPKAVCCSDGLHCCPEGDTCDVSAGTCMKEGRATPLFKKKPAKALNSSPLPAVKLPTSITCPDNETKCPDANTCCALEKSGYGCCPQDKGVCCSDHLHCCPEGYTCDLADKTCIKGDSILPLLVKLAPLKTPNVVCPDGTSQCPEGNTCCKLSSGQWGCCPLPSAVCCSDGVHCCPEGYTCDVSAGTCSKQGEKIAFFEKISAKTPNVVCPDGSSQCPEGNTCCKLSSGQWGCCPLPSAVCCSDGIHCCPEGYTCDVSAGTCSKQGEIAFFEKISAKTPNVVCPDGTSQCPEGNTCCKLSSGQWGCCPLPSAVCCSDGIHCCPEGYTCDVSAGTCSKQGEKIAFFEKISAKTPNVVCPDGSSQCPEGNTCCKLSSGQWGCCPLPSAVCCSDGIHCCPEGYTCDVSAGTCSKQGEKIAFFEKISAKTPNVVCPDGTSQCPEGNTCCKLSSGQWGCCPLPSAVCCSDGIHCCPEGYTCDVSAGTCSKQGEKIAFFEKISAKTPNVVCPDGTSQCPEGNTCCKLSSGQWGCCPLPSAVCCSDGIHCCPEGYTCDVSAGTCSKQGEKIAFFEKISAIKTPNVVCPDGTSQCPEGNTCCKLSSGQWGCCPLPSAVCCSDGVHCCPEGYTCDVSAGTCSKQGEKIAFFEKISAIKTPNVVCPDGTSQCPDGNTCCKLSSGQWGCCPLPSAVCCSDGVHCCPEGYTCDVSAGTCSKQGEIAFFEKISAKTPNVVCPDGTSQCPEGNTCCKLSSGQWGCCPLPSAVCCSDGVHCCPEGYTCDVSAGTCSKQGEIAFFEKISAKTPNVVCPDGTSQCPEGNTCCKLSSGQWGCCPLPSAVCCSDGVHCCPEGYTCDVSAGTCSKQGEKIAFFEKISAKTPNVVCPDGTSQCPEGNTCCKLSSGQWGCCPLPSAVCCSDGIHCCPEGYTCDVSAGTCSKQGEKIAFFEKISAKTPNVVCPDGTSQCPEGNTCCKLSSGQWGCCPLPSAVCCSDGVHCCPEGYTCDVSAGTCSKQGEKIAFFEKISAIKTPNVVCPDGTSQCPDGNTCCKLSSGQWGCCPLPSAVCCSDGVHCCPEGYTCDVSAGTCSKQGEIAFFEKISAKTPNVVCPDGTSQCPEGNTCCKLSSGQWGCCPLPSAVCCSDGVHCCPEGYTCDVSAGTCSKQGEKIAFFEKISAKTPNVVCPDGTSQCPEGNTCCKLSSGQWGCCPLPSAVCCSDGIHCCPEGYTCDVSAGTCSKQGEKIAFFEKISAKTPNVVCPDGTSQCPEGNTCCKLSSGQWGCCPLPSAVCCSDGVHCCPEGYTCDVSAGTCSKQGEKIAFFEKISAIKTPNVVCPDGTSQCPDGNTCCKLSSGQWGCCPLPSAVCCSDGIHCCPEGYTCDVSAGTCSKQGEKIAFFEKISAKTPNVVCPDGTSQCPDGNTCCKLSSGQWGCCPLPSAVCCSDGVHCCPEGYTCDVSAGTCSKQGEKIAFFEKISAIKTPNVVCPDGTSQCPDGNTCCKLSSGQWGCCPLPSAVCCSDGIHCCPEGYTCDVSAGTCSKQGEKIAFFEKISAKTPNVVCPDGTSQCPDGNTCCKLSSGQWGCCPLPSAVCCSDGVHCCPEGYTCDVSAGTCSKQGEIAFFEKISARRFSPFKPDYMKLDKDFL